MNKFFAKTVKKATLWAVVMAVVVAAAIVVCALFGFNQDATLKDNKSLTVTVNKYYYNTQKELVLQECESKFGDEKASYVVDGEMSGDDCQIVFVFAKDVDVNAIKTTLTARFDEITKADSGSALAGAFVNVSAASEVTVANVAKGFAARGVIAMVIFAVLAFGYIAIRNMNVMDGLWVGGSVLVSVLMAAALIILCRVPVTTTVSAIIAVAGLLTAAITVLTLNKAKNAQKETPSADVEERVLSSIPVKESAYLFIGLTIAVILVGVLGGTFGIWFAVASLLGLVVSAFVSLIAAPASKLCLDGATASKPAKNVYVGAKKTSKKEKKVYEKKAEVEEAKEEACEACKCACASEETVEETVEEVEEASEETIEETVEEAAEEQIAEETKERTEEVSEEE